MHPGPELPPPSGTGTAHPLGLPVAALLAIAGLALALAYWVPRPDAFTLIAVFAAVGLACLPATGKAVSRLQARLRAARPGRVAVGLFGLALLQLSVNVYARGWYLPPKSHDERSYYLQALMLASGRLWQASPAGADSFESFHMIVRPVYASIYFPGTAALFTPGVWLGLPVYATGVLLAAAVVPAGYLLLRPVLGGDLAAPAALLYLAGRQTPFLAPLIVSQIPSLLLGTLLLAAAHHYTRSPGLRRAALVGVAGGMLGITRPQDAAFFLLGALTVVVTGLPAGVLRRHVPRHAAVALLATAPFLGVVLVQNYGLTGSLLRTGYWQYTQTNQPGTGFLDHSRTAPEGTRIEQKAKYNRDFGDVYRDRLARGWGRELLARRVPEALASALPTVGLVALFPLGLVGLSRSPAGRGLLVAFAGFGLVYGTFTFYLSHYVVPATYLFLSLALAAVPGLGVLVPRWREPAGRVGFLVAIAMLMACLPETNRSIGYPSAAPAQIIHAARLEAALPIKPAVVLYRFGPGADEHQEPVYNLDARRIEDNPVIRAHDLTPELNARLFRALAEQGPRRRVYRVVRPFGAAEDLGWADEAAAK